MNIPRFRLASFYFFYFSTLGAFLPYWGLYLTNRGFSALEIGELSALMTGTKIIAPNMCGAIADYMGKSLRVIRIASFLAMILFTGFLFKTGYEWFAIMTLGFSFFWNATLPQFEAATLAHLQHSPNQYGKIRLWGSIGFIVSVIGIGKLLDDYSIQMLPELILSLFGCIWLLSLITPEVYNLKTTTKVHNIWSVLKQPEVRAFLLVYVILQICHSPYYVFFSVYLTELNYSSADIGRLWALAVFAEVVMFVFMNKILKLISIRKLLLNSILLSMCRWLIMAFYAESITWMYVAQLFHAVTFGAAHIVAMQYVQKYFGLQHQGKGQAIYSSASFGLGSMLGSLLSGHYWVTLGADIIYLAASCGCIVAFIISFIWVGRGYSFDT